MGIDISKKKIDIALIDGSGEIISEQIVVNTATAIASLLEKLTRKLHIAKADLLICCEETGIYSRPLQKACVKAGFNLWVEMAYKIKKATTELRGKSDRWDALRIAQYAKRYEDKVKLYKEPEQACQKLQTLLHGRDALLLQVNQLEQQINESKDFDPDKNKLLKQCYQKPLTALKNAIKKIENSIAKLKEQDASMKQKIDLIKSIPGIGEQTALNFMVYTRNFTLFDTPNHLASYAGVAPFANESGTIIKKPRVSGFANHKLKKLLHLAAMSATRAKGDLRDYYIRKVKEGKNKMLVLNNVRNKLVHRMFAVLKKGEPYIIIKSEPALAL